MDLMDRDKKTELVQEIEALLQSCLSRGLTEREIALALVEKILFREVEKILDQRDQLAFAHRVSKFYQ